MTSHNDLWVKVSRHPLKHTFRFFGPDSLQLGTRHRKRVSIPIITLFSSFPERHCNEVGVSGMGQKGRKG